MYEKIYVVVMLGCLKSYWFPTLEAAKGYIDKYAREKTCYVYEYSLCGEAFRIKPPHKRYW